LVARCETYLGRHASSATGNNSCPCT
jgi:hypothetical protein